MPVQLSRAAGRLLKTVAGKPHASSEDHDEGTDVCVLVKTKEKARDLTREEEKAIFGDPLSSSGDEVAVTTAVTSSKKSALLTKEKENSIFRDPLSSEDEGSVPAPVSLITPPPPRNPATTKLQNMDTTGSATKRKENKRNSKKREIKVPKRGVYETGKAQKEGKKTDAEDGEEKENKATVKRPAEEEDEDDMPIFGSEMERPAKRQRIANIHAPPPKRAYGKQQGSAAARQKPAADAAASTNGNGSSLNSLLEYSNKRANVEEEDNDSDSSDVSMRSLHTPQKEKKSKKENSKETGKKVTAAGQRKGRQGAAPPPRDPKESEQPSLLAQLSAYRDLTPSNSQATNVDQNSGLTTPLSSLPSSALPAPESNEDATTPDQRTEHTCSLCEEAVPPSVYTEFWSDKEHTSRHEREFCLHHTHHSALAEYTAKGYPEINWDALPARISTYHAHLTSILNNTTPSAYRALHAATTSSTRRAHGDQIYEANADYLTSYTGYYGSRGGRVMMETMMGDLAREIREASRRDEVVRALGVANFVLRVLVPEITVRLVMEDFGVGVRAAEGVVRESGDLGGVVNGEVGDVVVDWGEEVERERERKREWDGDGEDDDGDEGEWHDSGEEDEDAEEDDVCLD